MYAFCQLWEETHTVVLLLTQGCTGHNEEKEKCSIFWSHDATPCLPVCWTWSTHNQHISQVILMEICTLWMFFDAIFSFLNRQSFCRVQSVTILLLVLEVLWSLPPFEPPPVFWHCSSSEDLWSYFPSYHLCYSSFGRLHVLWRITCCEKQVW